MANLKINICGVEFKNPLIAASGTFGFGREFNEFYDVSLLGGICSKGLTLKPRLGNGVPRIAERASSILNAVGLQNPGVDYFIKNDLEFMKSKTVAIINIAGNTSEDYVEIAKKLDGLGDFLELNISCPNVKEGGISFGVKPHSIFNITKAVKNAIKKTPLMVKLSPNVESIKDNAKAAEDGGANCISLINTLTGMAIDIRKRKPILANITGGVSGSAIKPIAVRMVYEAYKAVKIPIIGIGGICNYKDVVEFLLAGASLVQIGTANFSNPLVMPEIINDLNNYLNTNKIEDVKSLIGGLIV